MSLRAFHIVFIAAATLLAAFVGVWFLRQYMAQSGLLTLLSSLASFAAALSLLLYGSWFLRKVGQRGQR